MNFFTHDQINTTLLFLYPNARPGLDYQVLMYVDDYPEYHPISDGWIERWSLDVEQPSIEYLKQVYEENNLGHLPVTEL